MMTMTMVIPTMTTTMTQPVMPPPAPLLKTHEMKCAQSGHVFIISDQDKDYIMGLNFNWNYGLGSYWLDSSNYYISTMNNNVTMHLQEIIMMRMRVDRPSSLHFVKHMNGNTLDNTRDNLQWIKKARKRKRGRRR